MDFFKFNPTSDATILERGEIINGIDNSMWVERYYAPGEFKFEAQLSTGLSGMLPIGTIISHVETLEVMIVENHEIKETTQEDPTVIISGRSFVSYLENRVAGGAQARTGWIIAPYNLAAAKTWAQIVTMINAEISSGDDALPDVIAATSLGAAAGTSEARTIKPGPLLKNVQDLLAIDDLGIRTIRQNDFTVSYPNTTLEIYKGIDKSAQVLFSWKEGELDSAEYLLTQKDYYNSAVVMGQYLWVVVDSGPIKYDRRIMFIDATDIDGNYGFLPGDPDRTTFAHAMETRGRQTLANQNLITISQSDISKMTKYRYRKDYNMGDLVTIDGNYNQMVVMRVIEYAEIEDENGESGHPTLALPIT